MAQRTVGFTLTFTFDETDIGDPNIHPRHLVIALNCVLLDTLRKSATLKDGEKGDWWQGIANGPLDEPISYRWRDDEINREDD